MMKSYIFDIVYEFQEKNAANQFALFLVLYSTIFAYINFNGLKPMILMSITDINVLEHRKNWRMICKDY